MTREEAIEVYRGLINTKIKEAFEFFAPELAESEDEKIIRDIHDLLVNACEADRRYPKLLAWLEKQKEQKPAEKEITLTDFEKVLDTFLFDFANSTIEDCEPKDYIKKHSAEILKAAYKELNAQLQQDLFEAKQEGRYEGYEVAKEELKPAEWSEEEKDKLNSIERLIVNADAHGNYLIGHKEAIDLQHFIRSIVKPTTNLAEWSEEDERMRNQLIYDVEYHKKEGLISAKQNKATKALYNGIEECYDEKIAWLKSLPLNLKKKNEDVEYKLPIDQDKQLKIDKDASKIQEYFNKQQKPEERFEEAREKYQVEWSEPKINGNPIPTENQAVDISPVEWSEEDERIMNGIQLVLESWDRDHSSIAGLPSLIPSYISWLKSRRPSWKPSQEQMNRLSSIIAALRKDYCDDMADFLASIYHNLEKLM